MSLVKISGNASGTGTLTIAAPNTNTNYTLTLPTASGTFLTNSGTEAGAFSTLSVNSNNISAENSLGFRNRIINGAMVIDQRNAGAAVTVGTVAAGTYGVDRWWGYTGTGSLWQVDQVSTSNTDFPFATRIQRIAGQTSTSAIYWGQVIEYNNMFDMAGQSATLSFYATAGANFSGTNVQMYVFSGTVADQGASSLNSGAWTGITAELNGASAGLFTPTSTRQRFTFTFTLDAGIKELCVRLNWSGSGTAGANDYIDITGVQLEVGSVATPFERRPYGTELMLCQRYYYLHATGTTKAIGSGGYTAFNILYATVQFPVSMRTAPTTASTTGTNYYNAAFGSTNDGVNSFTVQFATEQSTFLYNNTEASGTANSYAVVYTNNASSLLAFQAEL